MINIPNLKTENTPRVEMWLAEEETTTWRTWYVSHGNLWYLLDHEDKEKMTNSTSLFYKHY